MTQTEKIAQKIDAFLRAQQLKGIKTVDLTALEVSKLVGISNRMPMCVSAMKLTAAHYKTEILHDVPSGKSSTVEIRYYLK